MVKGICQWILYKRLGYKKIITQELPEKYIICMAPHTSNWDLILGQLFAHAEGIKCNFLMKKEWFFWPLGPIFRKMGGIPVWRSKHTSMTDNLAAEADKRKSFGLCITPEGTRSLNPEWKKDSISSPSRRICLSISMGLTMRRRSSNAPGRLSRQEMLTKTCVKSSCTSRISKERNRRSSQSEILIKR